MSKISNRITLAAVAVLFPIAAFADLSGTVTLQTNTSINLDTGATVSSGGDLRWNGSSLTPQGGAKALNVTSAFGGSFSGASGFASLSQQVLQAGLQAGLGSNNPINSPAVDNVIGALTNGVNYAKLLVTAVSPTSITLQYTTYGATGGSGGSGGPTITMIQNNYSYIVPGLPNYGIAPGTLFIIKGTGLASAATVSSLQDPAVGIPLSLNGASISVKVGGVTTTPGIYYAIGTQIGAVLPSNTPVGTGTLTVTYNGVPSAAAPITVVPSAFGLDTYYGTGTGLGVATNPLTGALYNFTNSITPGSTVVLWGSGLGATGDSDTVNTSTPHAVPNAPTFYIGGIAVTPLYAGRSVYPGVNQVNLTIPASVQTGCGVAVVAVSGNVVSNTVSLPISANGGVCSDPLTGITGTQIGTLGGKTTYNSGFVALLQSTGLGTNSGTQTSGTGIFQSVKGITFAAGTGVVSVGSCIVASQAITSGSIPTITGLDAGNLSITGPTGTQQLPVLQNPLSSGPSGIYIAQLPANFIPGTGGSFTFTGTGGANVGAFNTSISYTNPLSWTNMNAIPTVNRAQGQNVTWTGGAAGTYVYIGGSSSSSTASASFTCYAPASAGQFTVPAYVLLALPAGNGGLTVQNTSTPVAFNATGLDYGTAFAGVTFSISPSYQ